MAVRLEPEVRENPPENQHPVASNGETANARPWRPMLVEARFAPDPGAAVSAEDDGLRTARGILFGLAISLAAWTFAGLIWWAT